MRKNKIITLWGIFDLIALTWYLGWRVQNGQIPFYYDVSKSMQNASAFGIPSLSLFSIISLVLYVSLALSGVLLIKQNKYGAVVSYIQTPFRIFTFIPPSIFFIIWPLKYIVDDPKAIFVIITGIILIMLSETLKVYSVTKWQKQFVTAKQRPAGRP